MKIQLTGAAAALLLLTGAGIAAADTIVLQPQQETVVREYIEKQPPLASIDLPGVSLDIGSPLPDTVELHTIEAPDIHYDYTVIGGRTYVVDPGTREIIQVLD